MQIFIAGRKSRCLPVRTLALRIIIFHLSLATAVNRLSSRSKNTWGEYYITYMILNEAENDSVPEG